MGLQTGSDQKVRTSKMPVSADLTVQAIVFFEHMQGLPRSSLTDVQDRYSACQWSSAILDSGGVSPQVAVFLANA